MTPEEALQYLHNLPNTFSEPLSVGARAYRWTRVLGRALAQARVSLSGNQILTFVLMAMVPFPPERVMAGILELKRLERALVALGMPHDEVHASFLRYGGNIYQALPPLYEMYMISAGRAQEIITDHRLARYLETQIDDALSLQRYRGVYHFYARPGIQPCPSPQGAADEVLPQRPRLSVINLVGDQTKDLLNCYLPGSGTRLAATHKWLLEERACSICFGVALFDMFLGYDPNEERGAPISELYRTYPTLFTLTECFFGVLEHFGVDDGRWKFAVLAIGIPILRVVSMLSGIFVEVQGYLLQPGRPLILTALCYAVYLGLFSGAVFAAMAIGLIVCWEITFQQMDRRLHKPMVEPTRSGFDA
ncbi:MAG: hypothetical protein Q9208_002901 [Pyrenodesmia sp. 3 TL-2023]